MLNKSIKKKCQNFRELGYSSINEEDLLTYLLTYRWKKQARLSVKDCRKDIQKVKPNEFLTINNYWHRHQKSFKGLA